MNYRRLGILMASIMYTASWFFQVVKDGCRLSKACLPGWEAVVFALAPFWDRDHSEKSPVFAILSVLSAFTNLVFIFSAIASTRLRQTRLLSYFLGTSALINTVWLSFGNDLRAGYYLWSLSFIVLAVSVYPRKSIPR